MRVDIPNEFVDICTSWHGGQDTLFYAISSCGYLGIGSIRPVDCNTDEEWIRRLLGNLDTEIHQLLNKLDRLPAANELGDRDYDGLVEFGRFVNEKIQEMANA